MRPISKYIGGPVSDVRKPPHGYILLKGKYKFEYGGTFDFIDLHRDKGFGSADPKLFPQVHVKDEVVVQGPGLRPFDYEVIARYRTAINSIRARLDSAQAPDFTQSPDALISKMEAGANMPAEFTVGYRKQMEDTVRFVEDSARGAPEVTGVELKVGKKWIDLSI